MSLWENIQPHLDPDTGLLMAPDGGKDNLILYSAYLRRGLYSRNEFSVEFPGRISAFIKETTVAPGLYLRNVGNNADNSVDNIIGAAACSSAAASDINSRWYPHLTCYDVNNPGKVAINKNFYGRFLGLKAYLAAASGNNPGILHRLAWIASSWFTMLTAKGASDLLLLSLQADAMQIHCPLTVAAFRRKFPLKDLYSQYFGPMHPLTLAS